MRAVDVVAADNDNGQLKALHVRVHQHLGSGFAGSVGVGGGQDAGLQQIIVIILDLTVNLVCGNMDKTLNANLLGSLE